VYTSIVTGTDGSPTANAAMGQAFELARRCAATVHVVSVCRPLTAMVAAGAPEASALVAMAVSSKDQEVAALRSFLDETCAGADCRDLTVVPHLLEGDPSEGILKIAEQEKADLIVVGNRGMHGARRVLGSVPNTISHRARCSVLIVQTT
jgi:nucleotide-binding universal stress UspA family protein